MKKLNDALELGATMYVPATRDDLWKIVGGGKYPSLKSVVICLEDSVHERDVSMAMKNLIQLLKDLKTQPTNDQNIAVFVRPRNLAMAQEISDWNLENSFNGFVVPKFVLNEAEEWFKIIKNQKNVMLTLETCEYFDIGYVSEVKESLMSRDNRNILCLRIGGNDLLSSLNLRRPKKHTIYETPVGLLIPQLVGIFVPDGFQLSSPVFEHIDSTDILIREITLDKANGLLTKTAIHPSQIKLIHDEYKVSSNEYYESQLILDSSAKSVFKVHGSMLEPATHRNWASQIQLRSALFGITETHIEVC